MLEQQTFSFGQVNLPLELGMVLRRGSAKRRNAEVKRATLGSFPQKARSGLSPALLPFLLLVGKPKQPP